MALIRYRVDDSATDEDAISVWQLYEPVFGDHASLESWREAVWDKHRVREGFRLACAFNGDELVGFAYGYTGQRGQWWTDNAAKLMAPEVAAAWLGGHFELVSVAVAESARGAGVGRGLMQAITANLPHERMLLMTTSDPSDPARRLYASEGWHVIAPGIADSTVIMGKANHAA